MRAHVQGPAAPDGRTVLLNSPLAPSREVVRSRVLPRLLQAIAEESNPDLVSAALVAAGRLADPGEINTRATHVAARGKLVDPSFKVRESALLALGLLGSPEATTDLVDIVRQTPRGLELTGSTMIASRLRAFAAHALGLAAVRTDDVAERQRIVLELVDVLESEVHARDDIPVAAVVSLGLVDLGPRMVVPAKELRERAVLEHVLSARSLASYVGGWMDAKSGQKTGRSNRTRSHACIAHARVAATADERTRLAAVERLVDVSDDRAEHVHVRTSAAIALGEVARAGQAASDREARRQLLRLVHEGQPLERRFSRIALASACSRPGEGDDPWAGTDEVRKVLSAALPRSRASDLAWTALALGILDGAAHEAGVDTGPYATSALRTMAVRRKSDDDSAALGIALALAARGTDREQDASELVVKELGQTTTPIMRGHLEIALGLLEHDAAAKTLRSDLVKARNQPVLLWSAAVGLGLMGEPVGHDLVEALKGSTSTAQRIAITAALGQTGTAPAVNPLLEMLDQDQIQVQLRASAVDALGAICDLERLPWRDPIAHAMPYFAATPSLNGSGSSILERPW
ncbi:MAG: hypothetical protein AAGI22_09880 [Planctomycetota bacterium]